ncbi:MAG: tetratricopeptide repeat protein [Chitinivibrionales bacterium]|nr:tetratricopeptide repeat protein [Chitinivibrionales bacterium]
MSKSVKNKPAKRQEAISQQPGHIPIWHALNRDWILGLLLCVVAVAVYLPSINGKQIWDDDQYITKPELRSLDGLGRIWTQLAATRQFYPLVYTVFWLEHRLWGDATIGYHIVNLLLHLLGALLLVRLLRRLQIKGAWLIAAVFAIHPIQVESVAWIAELKNTLSGVFYFAAALAYVKFDHERKWPAYALALVLFILGLITKSVIATLPVSLLVIIWWQRGKIALKQDILPILPFFMAGIALGLFTVWIEHTFIGAQGSEYDFTLIERCLIAGRVVWFYLGKLLWPADLIFMYGRWNVSQAVWWQYLFPAATMLLGALLWVIRRRSRAPLAAFLYFTATLFPVMGFVNVYPFRFSFVADHFQYLACLGPIVLAVGGGRKALALLPAKRQRLMQTAVTGILLAALCLLTLRQSAMYANAEELYTTVIRKNPGSWMAHNNLGVLLSKSGRTDEAMTQFWKALEIKGNFDEAHYNLGMALLQTGHADEAMAQFRRALVINPDYAEANINLGNALMQSGRVEEAMAHFRRALETDPTHGDAHYNLGNALLRSGRPEEAMAEYQKAITINPRDDRAHTNLGLALLQKGQTDQAISQFRTALEINPGKAGALKNLAIALAQKGQLTDAISLLQRARAQAESAGDIAQEREIAGTMEKLSPAGALPKGK